MRLRIRYRKEGGHVRCRFFTNNHNGETFAKAGELMIGADEFDDFRDMLGNVEFLKEDME